MITLTDQNKLCSEEYLLSIGGQVRPRWIWNISFPQLCLKLSPLVRFQAVAEGVTVLSILLCLMNVDVALSGCRPRITEQAVVLSLSSLGL